MIGKEIAFEKENGVAVISICATPKSGNELAGLAETLAEVCAEVSADKGVTVALFKGETDVMDMGTVALDIAPGMGGLNCPSPSASLASLECPVIAAALGRVTGQGLEMLLACDVRLADAGAAFSMPQLRAGLIPNDGGTQRLCRTVGQSRALEMILTGREVDGAEALRIGLVNRLVPAPELPELARDMAARMAVQAPFSLRFAKEAILKGGEMSMEQGLRLEADLYFLLHTTRDRREGIEAFLAKRKPQFTGE